MKYYAPLIACAATLTLGSLSCFRPSMECAPCTERTDCGGGLACLNGLCQRSAPSDSCVVDGFEQSDAPSSDGAAAVDVAQADTDPSDTPPMSPDASESACIDRCCVGAACLEFPPRLRQGLLLWADRTTLSQPGGGLEQWTDRSRHGNHLMSLNDGTPPTVQLDPVGPIAQIDNPQMVLATRPVRDPALSFATEDFSVLALVQCDPSFPRAFVFQKRTSERPLSGITLYCNHDGSRVLPGVPAYNRDLIEIKDHRLSADSDGLALSQRTDLPGKLHLLTARRADGNRLQIRIDGVLESEVPIDASVDLVDDFPMFVGSIASAVPPYSSNFQGKVASIIVVRGPLEDDELAALESFVISTNGEGAPRF